MYIYYICMSQLSVCSKTGNKLFKCFYPVMLQFCVQNTVFYDLFTLCFCLFYDSACLFVCQFSWRLCGKQCVMCSWLYDTFISYIRNSTYSTAIKHFDVCTVTLSLRINEIALKLLEDVCFSFYGASRAVFPLISAFFLQILTLYKSLSFTSDTHTEESAGSCSCGLLRKA